MGDNNRNEIFEPSTTDVEAPIDESTTELLDESVEVQGSVNSKIRGAYIKSALCLTALGAGLAGGFLSSCAPTTPVKVESPTSTTAPLPTEIPILEDTPEYVIEESTPEIESTISPPVIEEIGEATPTVEVVIEEVVENIPYVSTEKNEAFDMNSINILEWEDFTLEKDIILEESEIVTTAREGTDLYLFPGGMNISLSLTTINILKIPEGFNFDIKQKKIISNSRGESVTLGIIGNNFAYATDIQTFALVLDGTDKEEESQGFVEKREERYPSVTFFCNNPGLKMESKETELQMLSLLRLSQYQMERQGFQTNQPISLKNTLNPIDSFTFFNNPYLPKFSFYRGTDNIASALKLLSQKESHSLTLNNSMHYFGPQPPGPFTVGNYNWSSALGKKETEDFNFTFNGEEDEKYYISIEPMVGNVDHIIEKGSVLEDGSPRIVYGANISLIKYKPEEEQEVQIKMENQFNELQTIYENYISYYYEKNKDYKGYIVGEELVPMDIPREIEIEEYNFSQNNIVELFGDDAIFQFIPMDLYNIWFNKSKNNMDN